MMLKLRLLTLGLAVLLLPAACMPTGNGNNNDNGTGNENANDNQAECTVDEDCDEGEVCTDGVCEIAPCETDDDCAEGETCEDGTCVEQTGTPCETEADCELGESCTDGLCAPTTAADVQLGKGVPVDTAEDPCNVDDDVERTYETLPEGGSLPVCTLGQGGIHTFISFRVTGFSLEQSLSYRRSMTYVDDGSEVLPESTIPLNPFFLTELEGGVIEGFDVFDFLLGVPGDADGREAILNVEIIDDSDPPITASISQTIVLTEFTE